MIIPDVEIHLCLAKTDIEGQISVKIKIDFKNTLVIALKCGLVLISELSIGTI